MVRIRVRLFGFKVMVELIRVKNSCEEFVKRLTHTVGVKLVEVARHGTWFAVLNTPIRD